ncbi:hypothetical protein [Pontibacter vulgaris]|uniref:hypothetical protein n=1 Tax=Pontibacter vulgaris TaxID=2905679 RepID=UPI001FA7FEC4|nr:hypothetical protein [Pontibacter vulgaris]
MKNTIKLAFAAFALFAFTACGNETNTATESETTDQVETDMDTEMDTDTTTVQDTTVNDGVADEIKEEQPPVQ